MRPSARSVDTVTKDSGASDSISFHVVVSSSAVSKQDSHCWGAGKGSCVDLAADEAEQTFQSHVHERWLEYNGLRF